jgi:hypothetical protein
MEFYTQKMNANKTMTGQAAPNHRRRKGKKVKVTLIQLHTTKTTT